MNKWTARICEVNGINIHYLRTGGDKPPVVLLHGLMTSGACWTPLARALEEDYDVIMPDARGHGKSSAPSEGYCYDKLAADVLGLIEALGLIAPVVIGHSMGGMTAAVVANQNPKLLRGLVLADPTFLTPQRQREVYESDVAAQHRRVLNQSKEDFLAEIRMRHSHRSCALNELFAQARFQTSIDAFEILKPPNPDYVQLIKTLDIPSLLVIGGVGAVVSPEVASELARLNQRLKVVQIEEAGHGVPYDQPERFSAIVKVFLSSLNKSVNLSSVEDLDKLLSRFQINPDNWLKRVSALYDEVKNGDCILAIEDGKLHRSVNGVVVKCFYTNSQGERYQLFEEKQVFKNGQTRERGHKFVAEKLQSGESPEQGALRGLAEELQISGPDVHVIPLFEENKCDTIESPDYRGIQTSYNTYVFSCEIPDSHYKNYYVEDQEDKKTFFSWVKI